MRILIVDDSKAMQVIVKRGLSELGYDDLEYQYADNGSQALEIAKSWQPELVLSDWHMPEMNGLELLRAFQQFPHKMKIGLVTTETSEKKIQQARDAGARFIVNKPFDSKTLHEAVLPIIQGCDEESIEDFTDRKDKKKGKRKANNNLEEISETENEAVQEDGVSLPRINHLSKALNALCDDEILLEEIEILQLDNDWLPSVVGLYADSVDGTIHGICLLDLEATCILGGLVTGVAPEKIQIAVLKRAVPKDIFKNLNRVFQMISVTLFNPHNHAELEFRNKSSVTSNILKLRKLVQRPNSQRLNCEVGVLGYGQGKIIIVTT